jgi:hypothetical protein
MKNGLRLSLTLLAALPALAGEDPLTSAKAGLPPSSSDLDSSKSGLASSKGGLESPGEYLGFLPFSTAGTRSRWQFGVGVGLRNIGKINFDTGASRFQVPGVFGGNIFIQPPGIGAENGLIARVYDDGFVRPGPRTPVTGRTTDYEYRNEAQIRGNHLLMSADGGERRVVTATGNNTGTSWENDSDWEISPFLSLSRIVPLGKGWRAGPTLQFSFTPIDGDRDGLRTLLASERRNTYEVRAFDRFDTTGLVLPSAPYTGSPGAIAPLLPVEPASRTFDESLRSVDQAFFNDSIQESLEVNLFGFSLGADAYYEDVDGFFVGMGTGLVLNVADWDARRSDRLFQMTNGGPPVEINAARFHDSGTDLLFGAYLQGMIGFELSESVSVQGSLRYDWNESLRDSVGDSDFDVDLSGFNLSLGLSYGF